MPALVTIAASRLRRRRDLGEHQVITTLAPADTLITWNMPVTLEDAAQGSARMAPANTIRAHTEYQE